jgi:leucyl aminopeptidase
MQEITLITDAPTIPYQQAIAYREGTDLTANGIEITPDQAKLIRLETKSGKVARIPTDFGVALVVGADGDSNRDFAANAIRATADAPLVFDARKLSHAELSELVEGALLGGKTPTSYKSSGSPEYHGVQIWASPDASVAETVAVAREIIWAREIINTPANDLYPESFAARVLERASGTKLEVEVWDEAKLELERCGGILAVGRGSVRPPRLVKLTYNGGGKHLGLAGKGITFDTGGLSLKPAESMVGMKYDMAGAATALAATLAIAKLELAVTITTVLCLAENMPSGEATRPGDVAKIRNGKTVEILNTDAEGRLVLADGLSLLSEMKPDHIVDVATLTGAATIALGRRLTGLMGTGAAIEAISGAAKSVDEAVWHMPLPEELRPLLDSELADLTNVKIGNRAGGMLIGGLFLREFVDSNSSWAHLDIASAANNDGSPYSVNPQGATGVMIRTLVQLAKNMAS